MARPMPWLAPVTMATRSRSASEARWPASRRGRLDEARPLVHVLVEEGEHRNGAIDATLEEEIHHVRVLVAQEDAHLDAGLLLGQTGHARHVPERRPAPVLGDDDELQGRSEPLQHLAIVVGERDRVEGAHERGAVRRHLLDILGEREAFREALPGEHERSSPRGAPRAFGYTTTNP